MRYKVEFVRPERVVMEVQAEDVRGAFCAAERGEGDILSVSPLQSNITIVKIIPINEEEANV